MTVSTLFSRRTLTTASAAGAALLALGAWLRQDNTVHAQTLPQSTLPPMTGPAPALFIGHGSPMNAIRSNRFTQALTAWGQALGRPKAILMVSAHWLTERDTRVSTTAQPELI
jgi:4,5-DOPA dioxygenase extradiol